MEVHIPKPPTAWSRRFELVYEYTLADELLDFIGGGIDEDLVAGPVSEHVSDIEWLPRVCDAETDIGTMHAYIETWDGYVVRVGEGRVVKTEGTRMSCRDGIPLIQVSKYEFRTNGGRPFLNLSLFLLGGIIQVATISANGDTPIAASSWDLGVLTFFRIGEMFAASDSKRKRSLEITFP